MSKMSERERENNTKRGHSLELNLADAQQLMTGREMKVCAGVREETAQEVGTNLRECFVREEAVSLRKRETFSKEERI